MQQHIYLFQELSERQIKSLIILQEITHFQDLEKHLQILYNDNKFTANSLKKSIQEMQAHDNFIKQIIPLMAQQAIIILKERPLIQLLHNQSEQSLTRLLCFQFMSLIFFGLTDKQNYPDIQLPPLYNMKDLLFQGQIEKLKFYIHYFISFCNKNQNQFQDNIIFIKNEQTPVMQLKDWNVQMKLSEFQFTQLKNEDNKNCAIVDFSDVYFGGKILASRGCAQEEILLLIYPEVIVGTLIVTKVQDNQAVLIQNCLKYSNYKGYEDSLKWIYQNITFNNQSIIAIDSLDFRSSKYDQKSQQSILRQLNKAFVGFQDSIKSPISTGKWGCGIYRGDKYVNTLIQWAAASMAQRQIIFNALDDKAYYLMSSKLNDLKDKNISDIIQIILNHR